MNSIKTFVVNAKTTFKNWKRRNIMKYKTLKHKIMLMWKKKTGRIRDRKIEHEGGR